jgi:UDP-glucose 4-epimerase
MALQTPLMSTDRIRSLGWTPRHSATDALRELLDGIRDRAGAPTPPLHPAGERPRAAA